MAGKKTGKRLLTWVLVLVMALSLLPLNALADENGMPEHTNPSIVESEGNRGAHLVKSATKVGDTYKIQLESWVTGKFEQTTGSAPLDIVLVLDQSGSMAENGKLSSLKKAVSDFVAAINEDAAHHKVEHRIAIVGFARNGDDGWDNNNKWENTGLFINGELKKYITYTSRGYYEVYELDQANSYYVMQPGLFGDSAKKVSYNSKEDSWGYWKYSGFRKVWVAVTPRENENDENNSHTQFYEWQKGGSQGLTDQDYKDALVSSGENSIRTAISNLSASGTTRASYGMEMANKVFENNPNTPSEGRSRVVVFFTDGEPGYSGYETDEAGRAIAQAYATKHTHDAKVFSVGMFDKTPSKNSVDFMNYVSSNYPDANASEPSHFWEDWTITSGDPDADKYYMTVKGGDLSTVFEKISGSILTSDVAADANTVLTDKLSQYFDFDGVSVDEDGTVTGVTVQKQKYNGNGQAWGEPEPVDNVSVTLDPAKKTVTVSGFDYSNKDNVVTDGTNGTNASGYKLVVTFNVKPDTDFKDWGASGRYVTNSDRATLAKDNDTFATVDSPNAAVDTYQVTYQFDKTAPSDVERPVDTQHYISGQKATVMAPGTLDNTGNYTYTFNGWKNGEDDVEVGEKIDITRDVTLTGTWSKTPNTADYTVNYCWNNEPIPGTKPTTGSKNCGETVTVSPAQIEGYTPVSTEEQTITIDADNSKNVINFYYYKNVTLTANSDTVTYNGKEQTVEGYTCDTPNVTFEGITASGKGTDAGTYDVTFSANPVGTHNNLYIVTKTVDGTLTINKRSVTLTSASDSKVYDGTPLTNDNVTVGGEGFATGEGATYNVTGTITNVGKADNTFTYTLNEGTKATNYTITKTEGKLEITPSKTEVTVTITGNTKTETYNGSEQSVTGYTVTNISNQNYKATDFTFSGTAEAKGTDAGTYEMNLKAADFKNNNDNFKTVKFVIDKDGKLTISPRSVTLTSASDSKVYDGTPLTKPEVKVTGDGFADGEGATYKVTGTITNVGTTDNTFTYTLNEGTKADNYDITTKYGKLTITEASAPTPGTFDFNDVDHSDDKATPAITKTVKGNVGKNFKEIFAVTVTPKSENAKSTMTPDYYTGEAKVIASKSLKDVPFLFKPEVMANAVVPYGELRFTEAGTYTYTVREVPGGTSRMSYDTTEYTLTIKVVLNENANTYQVESWQFTAGNSKYPTPLNIVNTYRTYHPSAPSKPTLNTGDHYAYVMGYPDGTVRPNGSITRAEVSTILFRLLSDKTRDEYFTTESSFTDVKAGAWYNNSIATLEKAGVIVDTAKGGAFRPNEAITRAELAAMLAQFSDAKPVKGVKFSDVSAGHWAYEAIAIAAKMGWIEGYPDGTFRPDATITRAEMMTLVNRALERVPSDEDHLLSKRVMLTFPDCKSGDWFYIAVQEATNSHTYERAATEKNGDEQWTALRANRDWTQLEK